MIQADDRTGDDPKTFPDYFSGKYDYQRTFHSKNIES